MQQSQQLVRRINQIKFQQVIAKLNTDNFLKRMKFYASLSENKDATFNIPIQQIQFISFALSDAQIDTYIRVNKLIVHAPKVIQNEAMEVDQYQDKTPET